MPDTPADFKAFRAMSAHLGQDPLRVQGPGGNTSIKQGGVLWIKASGTELAEAETREIFVAVDRAAALAEAQGLAGDGSCKATVIDKALTLRPSIETTFHAALDWAVVAHTHSVATLTHAITHEGRTAAKDKLAGLPAAFVPYAKPGLPLTQAIMARTTPATQVFVLENHGLIICAANVDATTTLMEEVEARLALPARPVVPDLPDTAPPEGFVWAAESWIARDPRAAALARAGSYYPDHVVFLGPALPLGDHDGQPPAILIEGTGIALRGRATASQRAMLRCLSDVLARLPADWTLEPIGAEAETALLDWDAEKYRQALAARS
ncbi:class II aldolase/adducin family protein [Roseicyclus mahoneyensis]|uniref:Rhamnose utilization protein RhaD (Predicted bifunctional aldolase and dehydrogenase) n=1 Tax=Roseicyclus mahoneyensis TaxID=164332 RepID=A0A316GQT7_9RHOB|nr:class II aldolase/adducin family protein [Roseicyclus mahoneyensis]PWK62392.1 rhamnose utilization protein RhaD (predicted bifunctional aldolase and dehydrogenase) [Roseicyclus mahoneyensis]